MKGKEVVGAEAQPAVKPNGEVVSSNRLENFTFSSDEIIRHDENGFPKTFQPKDWGVDPKESQPKEILKRNPARSYADMAKKPRKNNQEAIDQLAFRKKKQMRAVKKAAEVAARPIGEPTEFSKLHFPIQARALKNKSRKEKNRILNQILSNFGIRKDVSMISNIGNSMVEIYFPSKLEQRIRDALTANDVLTKEYNPENSPVFQATHQEWNTGRAPPLRTKTNMELGTSRLAILFRKAHTNNLKKCVLKGLSEEWKDAILSIAFPRTSAAEVTELNQTSEAQAMEEDLPEFDLAEPSIPNEAVRI